MVERREKELVRGCLQGDREAMQALVLRYQRPVYNAAYRMLGNADDAADVAQTTFLKVFQNLEQFNPEFRFFSWIYRIAMNESINYIKRRPADVEIPVTAASPADGPDRITEAQQVHRELELVLAELSADYRSVIVLKYFVGCSYTQMAEILRIPEKTVKSRLFSARRRMKDALLRDGVEQP